jgi:3-oxoacyl-[acyl-carrier protein] reductase
VWENDWGEWERTIRVNLLSVVDLSRRCVPLLASRGGKIISISGGGATGPRARFTAYATAKVGLVRFCETLAQEVAALGIEVNCVAPGVMNTAMTEAILAAGSQRAGDTEHENALCARRQTPDIMERAASLCTFLASSESDGITGKLISAAWDPWDRLDGHRDDLQQTDVYTLRRIVPKDRGFGWENA